MREESSAYSPSFREWLKTLQMGPGAGTGTQDGKRDHPARMILETLHGEDVESFHLTA